MRTSRLIEDRYRPRLEDAGIATAVIETESEEELDAGVRLSTMHREPCPFLAQKNTK